MRRAATLHDQLPNLGMQFFHLALAGGLGRITGPENVFAIPSIAWRFQAAIIVWWTPCLAASSASVRSPRIASNATFALKSAL